jgi:hypothetical protein
MEPEMTAPPRRRAEDQDATDAPGRRHADHQVIGLGEKALSRESVMVRGSPITFSGTISMAWADVAIGAAAGQR